MAAIKILGSDTSNGNLSLSDNGETKASKGEVITWKVLPHSGVDAITAITVKPNSTNVFSTGPAKLGNSSNWQGKIKTELKIPTDEDYNIKWKDGNDNIYVFDPRIKVNT